MMGEGGKEKGLDYTFIQRGKRKKGLASAGKLEKKNGKKLLSPRRNRGRNI